MREVGRPGGSGQDVGEGLGAGARGAQCLGKASGLCGVQAGAWRGLGFTPNAVGS